MNDKLRLFLDKVGLDKKYYDYFNDGKILKLKLDSLRENGVFEIEVSKALPKEVIDFIDDNIKDAFPNMKSISATFKLSNLNYDDLISVYPDAILKSTLTKPMKELFTEKKLDVNDNVLTIEIDNIAEENILNNNMDSIKNYFNKVGYENVIINTRINEENREKIIKIMEAEKEKEALVDSKKEENPIIHGEEPK